MSIEPEFAPLLSESAAARPQPWSIEPQPPSPFAKVRRTIPSVGHALLFLAVAAGTLIATEFSVFALVMGLHLFGKETSDHILREPRLLIPSMAISYLIAGLLVWAIFTNIWQRPFGVAIRWNSAIVRRRLYLFLCTGILLSILLQFLSGYLPIPKTLPIDDFFRNRADVWIIAIFGTFVAPAFEELAFRGFMLPSLASAWDWAVPRREAQEAAAPSVDRAPEVAWTPLPDPRSIHPIDDPVDDPKWSAGALIFSSALTSVAFALLHADQLAHSWAPLSVLFAVSLVLCIVRLRYHSLAASTLVHASYNGTIFVLLFFASDGFRHLDKVS